ncbi:hypothetical protein FAVG1_12889 [Fusarium avenaceum]|nr:hypothetical protein FAVG1_12889 [Fusarium avenaceum]
MSSKVEVIIVGGGVSWLTFAHCLRNAGISYVLLEKGAEICFRGGASIGLMPHGLRILDQLGVCDQILGLTAPMHTSVSRLPSGKKFRESRVPAEIAKRHGYPVTFFEREELLQVLYENIPDKENIQTSQQVTDLQLDENPITVKTNQGRTWKAPIVVGADGIQSLVRKSIWKEIDQRTEGASLSQSQAIIADYYCTFGVSVYKSDDPEFIEGAGHVNFDHSRSTVVINSSRNKHFWFLIMKFNERKTYPNIPRFGEKDMEKMAAENNGLMVTEHTSFADLWRMRTKCAMVPLEEVVFDVWHANRLVLLGDSAHKVTPNAGQGGNSAIESAAVLVNLFHEAKTSHGNLENLNTAEITHLFQKYHANRRIPVKEMSQTSAFLTRLHAQDDRMLKVVGRHVFPFLRDDFDLNAVSNYVIGGPTLDFVQVKTKPALIPWEGWTLPDSLTARGNGVRSTLATLFVLTVFSRLLSTKMMVERDLQPLSSTRPNADSLSGPRGIQPPAVVLSLFGLGTTRLWVTLAILLNTLSMGGIIASESFRVMNLRLISARILIVCSIFVFCGLGFGGIVYSVLRIVETALTESISPGPWASRVSLKHAKTFNLSLQLAISTALSITVIPLFWPGLGVRPYVSSSSLLSFFPVMPWLFNLVFSKFTADQPKLYEVMKAHEDLPYLKKGWLLSGFCAIVAHISSLVSLLLAGIPILDIHSARATLSDFNISAPSSIDAEYLVFTISILIWAISAVIASNKVPRNPIAKLGFFAMTTISVIFLGPGAVVATLWTLNEDARRSTTVGI